MRKPHIFQEQVAIAIRRSIPDQANFVTELGADYKASHHQQKSLQVLEFRNKLGRSFM